MALNDMIQELLGVPGMSRGLAKTFVNQAFQKIQNEQMFSFQCQTGGWLTPGLLGGPTIQFLSPGKITVTPFTNTITGDAVATAAWTANVPYPPLLTQQQIRVPYYSLYNIIAIGTDGTLSYVTVDDPGSGQAPGTYTLTGIGDGAGAQIQVVVNANGTVTLPPVVVNKGSGYTAVTFTLAAGGTPATLTATLTAQLTIDRLWMEPPQVNGNYLVYQAYYPAPPNFKRWFAISDTTNNFQMNWWKYTQIDLANIDPERTIFDQPEFVVPLGIDNRPGSATIGQMMYELWPSPIAQLPYTFQCQCNWPLLSQPSDTVPYPLTDELVKERAYVQTALWKEGNKGDEMERGSGSNWQFLAQAHDKEYKELLKQIRIMDRHLMDLYFQKANMQPPYGGQPFASPNGSVNVGWI